MLGRTQRKIERFHTWVKCGLESSETIIFEHVKESLSDLISAAA